MKSWVIGIANFMAVTSLIVTGFSEITQIFVDHAPRPDRTTIATLAVSVLFGVPSLISQRRDYVKTQRQARLQRARDRATASRLSGVGRVTAIR